jgi:hypothetical protein
MTSTPAHPDADSSPDALVPVTDQDAGPVGNTGTHGAPGTHGHPDPRLTGAASVSEPRPISVLLYSDDLDTRAQVRMAVGRRLAADLPPVEWSRTKSSSAHRFSF